MKIYFLLYIVGTTKNSLMTFFAVLTCFDVELFWFTLTTNCWSVRCSHKRRPKQSRSRAGLQG